MNSIPSTFSEHQINRAVLGGTLPNGAAKMDVSVIMLNSSGNHLRVQSLKNLLTCGFRSVVSVEPAPDSFNTEELSRRYPAIKFVVPLEKASDGELVNMCMAEVDSEYVLVLRDSLHIPAGILLRNLAETLTKSKAYCVVPRLLDSSGQGISVQIVPEARRGSFLMTPFPFVADGLPTLFPFDFIGLYNREKFIQLGGFDYTISSSYWQNADLSLRAWLWGEKITVRTSFQISYGEEAPIFDATPDFSYLKFYLKNILPRFKDDHGLISAASFFVFRRHSSCGFFESLSLFQEARRWAEKNKFRFKLDVNALVSKWGSIA